MSEKIIEHIRQNASGTKTEDIIINGQNYKVTSEWKRRIHIEIKPETHLFTNINVCEIRKMALASLIARYDNYSLRGKRTEFTEKLLTNKFMPVLLKFPASKIVCQNNQVAYTARLKKKDIDKLEIIISYFKGLLTTL